MKGRGMGLLSRLTGVAIPAFDPVTEQAASYAEQLRQEQETNLLLAESIAEPELALDDTGWDALAAGGNTDFSRDGLRRATALCRLTAVPNPLMKRGWASAPRAGAGHRRQPAHRLPHRSADRAGRRYAPCRGTRSSTSSRTPTTATTRGSTAASGPIGG